MAVRSSPGFENDLPRRTPLSESPVPASTVPTNVPIGLPGPPYTAVGAIRPFRSVSVAPLGGRAFEHRLELIDDGLVHRSAVHRDETGVCISEPLDYPSRPLDLRF